MDIAAMIERGKTVSQMGEAPIMAFGPDIDSGKPLEEQPKFVRHFWWPPPIPGTLSLFNVVVRGELTDDIKNVVEVAATAYAAALGDGADYLLWRVRPEWTHERDFAEDTMKHCLYMRGTFVWLKAPPKEEAA